MSYSERNILNYKVQLKKVSYYLQGHNGFIAGGCFKNIFNGEKVKDVDIFFRNVTDFMKADEYFTKSEHFTKAYHSDKVQAFRDKHTGIVVELVRYVYGSPQVVIDSFDFTICKMAYYIDRTVEDGEEITEEKLLMHDDFFEHLHTHRLVVDDKMPLPVSTFQRMIKYISYGYMPCKETRIKIIQGLQAVQGQPIDLGMSLYNGFD